LPGSRATIRSAVAPRNEQLAWCRKWQPIVRCSAHLAVYVYMYSEVAYEVVSCKKAKTTSFWTSYCESFVVICDEDPVRSFLILDCAKRRFRRVCESSTYYRVTVPSILKLTE
jgi:hypothetical protein